MTPTNKQITDGNAIITAFTGFTLDPAEVISDQTKGKALWVELVKRKLETLNPPFHASWDWLIPAWQKYLSEFAKIPGVLDDDDSPNDAIVAEFENGVHTNNKIRAWKSLIQGIEQLKAFEQSK